jgi:RNA polymerase subunit RPABC4/transcription elongation factor Spt4
MEKENCLRCAGEYPNKSRYCPQCGQPKDESLIEDWASIPYITEGTPSRWLVLLPIVATLLLISITVAIIFTLK